MQDEFAVLLRRVASFTMRWTFFPPPLYCVCVLQLRLVFRTLLSSLLSVMTYNGRDSTPTWKHSRNGMLSLAAQFPATILQLLLSVHHSFKVHRTSLQTFSSFFFSHFLTGIPAQKDLFFTTVGTVVYFTYPLNNPALPWDLYKAFTK